MNYYDSYLNSIKREVMSRVDSDSKFDKLTIVCEVIYENIPNDYFAVMTLLDHANVWDERVDSMYEGELLGMMMQDMLFRRTQRDIFTELESKDI